LDFVWTCLGLGFRPVIGSSLKFWTFLGWFWKDFLPVLDQLGTAFRIRFELSVVLVVLGEKKSNSGCLIVLCFYFRLIFRSDLDWFWIDLIDCYFLFVHGFGTGF